MAKDGKAESGRRERRKHTEEFKREAVRLLYERRAAGVTVGQVARDLDVRPEQLRTWANRLREAEGSHPAMVEAPEQELRRLRRENADLKKEREFAKKVRCTSRWSRGEVRLHLPAPGGVPPATHVRRTVWF